MSKVKYEDLEVGKVYDVDIAFDGEFRSRVIAIVPGGDDWAGHVEFENGVTLGNSVQFRFWTVED